MSRQNYYKQRKTRRIREIDADLVVKLVQQVRQHHPRMGVRKLCKVLRGEFKKAGLKIGRDKLYDILRERDMLVKPLERGPRTTNSRHSLPVFRNLTKEVVTTGSNQMWVGDLTYIRTMEGYEYLKLIMDRHSRKAVGYHCDEDLTAAGCLKALDKALADLPEGCKPIHHSDRGCQYCSHEYVERLKKHGLSVSMTEENHCAENSHAERLNGILKQEYGLGITFQTRAQARRAVRQAVWLYNNDRPHLSLNLETPSEVHRRAA